MVIKLRTLVICGILFLVLSIGFYKGVTAWNSYKEDVYSRAGSWSQDRRMTAEEGKQQIEALEIEMQQGLQALKDLDYKEASDWMRRGKQKVESVGYELNDLKLDGGETPQEWLDGWKERYRELLDVEYDKLIEELKDGDVGNDEVQHFNTVFNHAGFPEYSNKYQKERQAIGAIRKERAKHWFRVVVEKKINDHRVDLEEEDYQDLKGLIEQTFEDKWSAFGPFKLVFGTPVDGSEGYRTWKTLKVTIKQDQGQYHIPGQKNNYNMPVVPIKMHLTFETKDAGKNQLTRIPTTWDRLDGISVESIPPERLTFTVERGEKIEHMNFEGVQAKYKSLAHESMLKQLEEELPKLEEFEPFPGQDPNMMELVSGGKFQEDSATILAYLSPEALSRKMKEVIQSDRGEMAPDIVKAVVMLGLEEFKGYAQTMIPRLPKNEHYKISRMLGENVDFADSEFVMAILKDKMQVHPQTYMELLKGKFEEPAVKEMVLAMANDKAYPHRGAMVYFAFSAAGDEEFRALARKWLVDEDKSFSIGVASSMASVNRSVADELMIEMKDQISDSVKVTLVRAFDWQTELNGTKETDFFKDLVLNSKNKSLVKDAKSNLRKIAYKPAAWDAVKSLSEQVKDPKEKISHIRTLCINAKRAYPEKAEAYVIEQMKTWNSEIYLNCVGNLLNSDGDKSNALKELAGAVRSRPQDKELVEIAISAVGNSFGRHGEWKLGAEATDLNYLLSIAHKSSKLRDRQAIHSALDKAIKKGHDMYFDMLKEAKEKESDPRAIKNLDRLITKNEGILKVAQSAN